MLTEQQNPATLRIDQLPTAELLTVMNQEDQKVALAVQQSVSNIALAVDATVNAIRQGGRLIYVGAGTSGRLGVLDAVECVPTYNTPPELVQGIIAGGLPAMMHSVEGAEDDPQLGTVDLKGLQLTTKDIVIGITASGRTPYVLGAIEYAKELGCSTVGISCNAPAPLLDIVHIPIPLLVGPEVVTGSTRLKSGTAQKMTLNMISTATMVKLGKVYGNLMVDVQITNAKLADRAKRIVMQISGAGDEEAQHMLDEAQGSAKVAIVMYKRKVNVEQAQELLVQHQGRLREIIG
jgi:N-acetylmuramic acid 6-phosphate etherase